MAAVHVTYCPAVALIDAEEQRGEVLRASGLEEELVNAVHQLRRRACQFVLPPDGGLQIGDQQSRADSLPADIAQQKGHHAGIDLEEVVQIAADLPDRQRSALAFQTIGVEMRKRD